MATDAQPPHAGTFEHRMPADPRNLAAFRGALRRWLPSVLGDQRRRSDVVLAASELASAAIRAATDAGVTVAARVWCDSGAVVVESRLESPTHRVVGGHGGAFAGNDGERGFSIVAALSESFGVKEVPSGVVVRARVPSGRFGAVGVG
jgi:hypothetical protein